MMLIGNKISSIYIAFHGTENLLLEHCSTVYNKKSNKDRLKQSRILLGKIQWPNAEFSVEGGGNPFHENNSNRGSS